MKREKLSRMMIVLGAVICLLGVGIVPSIQLAPGKATVVTNYPNPFDSRSGSTTILYVLDQKADIEAKIYDELGNLVKRYSPQKENKGIRKFFWDGTNEAGSKVAKGGYILVMNINGDINRHTVMHKIGVIH